MKKNISGLITACMLFILIALSLVFFNREPGRESYAENRKLAVFPSLWTENDGISPTLKEDLTGWFEDNLGLRDAYLTLSGILNYNILHRSKTSKVEIGNEGFLYLAEEGNLSLEASRSPDFIEKIPDYASDQEKIARKLKEQGIDYVFMIGPGKPSVYPEYIASSTHVIEDTIGDAMYDYMTEHTDVHVSWPKDLLIAAKDNPDGEPVYLQTDTHWTTYGRNVAYMDLIDSLSKWDIIDTRPCEVRFIKDAEAYVGDLSNMMGPVTWSGERLTEDSFTDWEIVSPHAKVIEQGEQYEEFQRMLKDKNVYNPELCVMYHNDEAPDESVLICGDSMIGICLLPQLAESFSDLTFVWSYSIDQDFIDFAKPDLVISEFGERELPLRLYDIRGFTE